MNENDRMDDFNEDIHELKSLRKLIDDKKEKWNNQKAYMVDNMNKITPYECFNLCLDQMRTINKDFGDLKCLNFMQEVMISRHGDISVQKYRNNSEDFDEDIEDLDKLFYFMSLEDAKKFIELKHGEEKINLVNSLDNLSLYLSNHDKYTCYKMDGEFYNGFMKLVNNLKNKWTK